MAEEVSVWEFEAVQSLSSVSLSVQPNTPVASRQVAVTFWGHRYSCSPFCYVVQDCGGYKSHLLSSNASCSLQGWRHSPVGWWGVVPLSSQLPVPWKAFRFPLASPSEQPIPQMTSSHSLLSLAFNATAQLEGFFAPVAHHGATLTTLQLSG